MVRLLLLIIIITALLVISIPVNAESTVDGDIQHTNFHPPARIYSFYDENLLWVFYQDGAEANPSIYYRTSSDGETWSSPTLFRASVQRYSYEIWHDGTYIHYIAYVSGNILYRRGNPDSDGTIVWSATEQNTGLTVTDSYLTVTTTGQAMIVYNIYPNADVVKNANSDGTWSTEWTKEDLFTDYMVSDQARIVALTGGKAAIVAGKSDSPLRIQCYRGGDQDDWSAEKTTGQLESSRSYSAVAQDDDVHIAYLDNVGNINYVKYQYSTNSFGTPVELYDGTGTTSWPDIALDESNNDLYVFYEGDPDDDIIYYCVSEDGGSNWSAPATYIDEGAIDGLPATDYYLNCDYTFDSSSYIGVYYMAGTYMLKFHSISTLTVSTISPTGITSIAATLRGEITETAIGQASARGFQLNIIESPTGATDIDLSSDCPCSTGVFSETVTDLEPDTIYYYRAYATDANGTVYGDWVSFLTRPQGADPEQDDEPDDGMTPPIPTSAPGGWIRPVKTYDSLPGSDLINVFADDISRSFVWFCLMAFAVVVVGVPLTGLTKHLGIVFIAVGMVLGIFIGAEYLDWWLILPYLITGIALLIREYNYGW